jgi:spermidine synthase
MDPSPSLASSPSDPAGRRLPILLLLFVGSGAAALIYEIVWFQLLQLVIGSSAVSLGVLLATFMGGMCLGSLLLPRLVAATHHPLRVYAALEILIGAFGVGMLVVMPLVGRVYTAWGGYGVSGFLLRGLVAGVCLLPPTLAMGATLPAVARWVETTPRGVSWLGFFYAGNIAGAVFGCLLAGFYLLRLYDMAMATYVAAALNVMVAAIGWALAGRSSPPQITHIIHVTPGSAGTLPPVPFTAPWRIYVAIALSGFCALAAEAVWTRTLGMLLGATVYTFSIILAVFLGGLGIGSSAGSLLARTLVRPALALGWLQVLVVGATAWSAYMLTESLPYWPVRPSMSPDIWFKFQIDLVRACWAILPPAVLWGASFPLALGALASGGQDGGRLVGGLYAANTLGAILGALGGSFLLVAWLGSQDTQRFMMVLSGLAGLLVLTPELVERRPFRSSGSAIVTLSAAAAAVILFAATVPPVPGLLVAYGRNAAAYAGQEGDIFYVGEGLNSSVAISRLPGDILNYHNAGKVQASSQPQDMRLQRMLGHLTTLVPERPRSVLVIGCGAGVTAGAVSIDPAVERVTIVEIEPLVPQAASAYFGPHNHDVVRNPKVRVIVDDARHYLVTTKETFDAITSDPLDPWVKGAATLYTKEFFELVRRRLNPGGVVTLFVQLYQSTPEAVKSEVATFFDVFPDGVIWGNTHEGRGYDTVLLGQIEPAPFDLERTDRRLRQAGYEALARSLGEVGIFSATDLFATYAGRASELKGWLQDGSINRDRNLRLQYLAGLGVDLYEGEGIYNQILQYRRFPADLFTGPEDRLDSLRRAILGPPE